MTIFFLVPLMSCESFLIPFLTVLSFLFFGFISLPLSSDSILSPGPSVKLYHPISRILSSRSMPFLLTECHIRCHFMICPEN